MSALTINLSDISWGTSEDVLYTSTFNNGTCVWTSRILCDKLVPQSTNCADRHSSKYSNTCHQQNLERHSPLLCLQVPSGVPPHTLCRDVVVLKTTWMNLQDLKNILHSNNWKAIGSRREATLTLCYARLKVCPQVTLSTATSLTRLPSRAISHKL